MKIMLRSILDFKAIFNEFEDIIFSRNANKRAKVNPFLFKVIKITGKKIMTKFSTTCSP